VPDHNRAVFRVAVQLERQLPPELEVLLDLDVDLELAAPDAPGLTRCPDLIVTRRSARERVRREGGIIRAVEVVVAEFVSPGSRRADHVAKRADYAEQASRTTGSSTSTSRSP
jgi:Uma2 family endonuclease